MENFGKVEFAFTKQIILDKIGLYRKFEAWKNFEKIENITSLFEVR